MELKDYLENYESPAVEIIEVEVEKGFATSPSYEGEGGLEDWV